MEGPPNATTLTCRLCESPFSNAKSLYKHLSVAHSTGASTENSVKGTLVCPLCELRNSKYEEFRDHLLYCHGKTTTCEKLEFDTFTDFLCWKSQLENDLDCKYACHSGPKILPTKDKKYFYQCNRSGFYDWFHSKSLVKRPRLSDAGKTSSTCPSIITVIECATTSKVTIDYWCTHLGHGEKAKQDEVTASVDSPGQDAIGSDNVAGNPGKNNSVKMQSVLRTKFQSSRGRQAITNNRAVLSTVPSNLKQSTPNLKSAPNTILRHGLVTNSLPVKTPAYSLVQVAANNVTTSASLTTPAKTAVVSTPKQPLSFQNGVQNVILSAGPNTASNKNASLVTDAASVPATSQGYALLLAPTITDSNISAGSQPLKGQILLLPGGQMIQIAPPTTLPALNALSQNPVLKEQVISEVAVTTSPSRNINKTITAASNSKNTVTPIAKTASNVPTGSHMKNVTSSANAARSIDSSLKTSSSLINSSPPVARTQSSTNVPSKNIALVKSPRTACSTSKITPKNLAKLKSTTERTATSNSSQSSENTTGLTESLTIETHDDDISAETADDIIPFDQVETEEPIATKSLPETATTSNPSRRSSGASSPVDFDLGETCTVSSTPSSEGTDSTPSSPDQSDDDEPSVTKPISPTAGKSSDSSPLETATKSSDSSPAETSTKSNDGSPAETPTKSSDSSPAETPTKSRDNSLAEAPTKSRNSSPAEKPTKSSPMETTTNLLTSPIHREKSTIRRTFTPTNAFMKILKSTKPLVRADSVLRKALSVPKSMPSTAEKCRSDTSVETVPTTSAPIDKTATIPSLQKHIGLAAKTGHVVFQDSGDVYVLEAVEEDSISAEIAQESSKTEIISSARPVREVVRKERDLHGDCEAIKKVECFKLELKCLASQEECKRLKLQLAKAEKRLQEVLICYGKEHSEGEKSTTETLNELFKTVEHDATESMIVEHESEDEEPTSECNMEPSGMEERENDTAESLIKLFEGNEEQHTISQTVTEDAQEDSEVVFSLDNTEESQDIIKTLESTLGSSEDPDVYSLVRTSVLRNLQNKLQKLTEQNSQHMEKINSYREQELFKDIALKVSEEDF